VTPERLLGTSGDPRNPSYLKAKKYPVSIAKLVNITPTMMVKWIINHG